MKTLPVYAVLFCSIFFTNRSFAQNSIMKDSVMVLGNCGMCKKTIEKSAKAAGATAATWDSETKQLNLSYATNKASISKIQEAIARSGYDTRDFVADDSAYQNLHGCCQYERKKKEL
ncbi:MAG: cation transporter [Ferruginibacter sp.]